MSYRGWWLQVRAGAAPKLSAEMRRRLGALGYVGN